MIQSAPITERAIDPVVRGHVSALRVQQGEKQRQG
jgi:hypothetical protein